MILSSHGPDKGNLNITVENFRPNLVVAGGLAGMPHQEDKWKGITITAHRESNSGVCTCDYAVLKGDHSSTEVDLNLTITGPCSRCSMVNVDGSSGSMNCRAFQALSTYRKDGSNVYFGQFCSLHPDQRLSQGDVWLMAGSIIKTF